jgi:hypothetical protein
MERRDGNNGISVEVSSNVGYDPAERILSLTHTNATTIVMYPIGPVVEWLCENDRPLLNSMDLDDYERNSEDMDRNQHLIDNERRRRIVTSLNGEDMRPD